MKLPELLDLSTLIEKCNVLVNQHIEKGTDYHMAANFVQEYMSDHLRSQGLELAICEAWRMGFVNGYTQREQK